MAKINKIGQCFTKVFRK